MTISRVPAGEPKRWKNGCLSLFLRLAVLFILFCAAAYWILQFYNPLTY